MKLIRQIASFGMIGVLATLTHVASAAALIELDQCPPLVANLAGAALAYVVSFLGNALYTFGVSERLGSAALRYLLVSLASAALTSIILIATQFLNLPILAYYALVLVTVPPTTFLLAKFWALKRGASGIQT